LNKAPEVRVGAVVQGTQHLPSMHGRRRGKEEGEKKRKRRKRKKGKKIKRSRQDDPVIFR
jgi:hypothetical protein